MKEFLENLKERAAQFTILDFSLLKVCLLAAGALIGAYRPRACRKISPFLWVLAAGSFTALLGRIFLKSSDAGEEDLSIYE